MAERSDILRRIDDPEIEERAVPVIPAESERPPLLSPLLGLVLVEKVSQAFEVHSLDRVDAKDVSLISEICHEKSEALAEGGILSIPASPFLEEKAFRISDDKAVDFLSPATLDLGQENNEFLSLAEIIKVIEIVIFGLPHRPLITVNS